MSAFLSVLAISFVAVLLVELPDKTLIATLVLSTRFRRRPVLLGVSAAFAVQCALAVTAGGLLRLLPDRLLESLVALLLLIGAFVLFRESLVTPPDEAGPAAMEPGELSSRRIALVSFGVLFAAEWGDTSQLATAGLVARYGQPLATGFGAFLALVSVAVLAALAGNLVLKWIPLRFIHRAAAAVFALLGVVAAVVAALG